MDERLPCPTCRQPVELEAELCLHCGAHLFVDVVLRSPVADGRVRYRLSRALSALPGAPPLGVIQSGLVASPATAARGVTRAYAHAVLPILAEHGLVGTVAKHVRPEPAAGFPPRSAAIGIAAVAALVVAYVGWQAVGRRTAPAEGGAAASQQATPLPATVPEPAAPSSSRALAQRALAAAAALRCRNSVGSGVFVAPDLVLTNAHVLCPPGEDVQVGTSDDRTYVGEVVRRDDRMDLGLVRVAGARVAPMVLGDVGEVAVGDRVTIVGSPVGLDFTVQEGSISSLQRSADGIAYLQLDAKVSPGNSGGPVIDAQGRVVGIVSMKVTGQGVEGIGLAIPINYAYSPSLAFVSPPSQVAAASAAFQRMVARALQGSDSGLREASAAAPEAAPAHDGRPLLVGGRVDQYGNLVVRVVRITEFPPRFEEIAVTVWNGLEAFCTIKGDIATWQQADPIAAASGPGLDPRVGVALRRIAEGRPVYVGESPLRWDLCDRTKMRSGVHIELQGASPLANRLQLR